MLLTLIVAAWQLAVVNSQGTAASEYFAIRPDRFQGLASNYGGPADGAWGGNMFGLTIGGCGYGDITNPADYPRRAAVAFDPTAPALAGLPSFGCGTCWKITNPNGNWPAITTMVTDICPECNWKHNTINGVDIDFLTWTGLVLEKDKAHVGTIGLLDVIIEQVNCLPQSSMELEITDFTGGWHWIRVRPEKVAGFGAVKSMGVECPQVMLNSVTWIPLDNTWGTIFEAKQNKFPLYVPGTGCRIWLTVADGQVVASPWLNMDEYLWGRKKTVNVGYNVDGVIYPGGLGGAPRWPYKEAHGRRLRAGNSTDIITDEDGNMWYTKPYQPPDMPQGLKDYLRQENMLYWDDA